jgi:acyl-CoA thioester hydrolase
VRLTLDPSTDPADYGFVHQVRTRFAETDAMGVIHHGAYAPYLEEARAALLRLFHRPYGDVRESGTEFAVLELYVRYRRPLYFDEVVDINVVVGHLTRTTFEVGYLLQVGGETRSTAVTVHGAIDAVGRPSRMPAWLAGVVDPTPPLP